MIRNFGQFNKTTEKSLSDFKGNIVTGRVTNIFLTETTDENLGAIEIKSISTKTNTTQIAYPFFANNTIYPLLDELVLCFNLPSQNIGSQQANEKLYYINPINVWGNNHVNFYPDPEATNGNIPLSEDKSYEEIFSNKESINTDNKQSKNSQPGTQGTFKERDNIHPLQPYMGDIIYQGRFGNSIRFGSTNINPVENKGINPWSKVTNNNKTGDPILIFRNGQPDDEDQLPENPWDAINENIDFDKSSLFLTSTQKIPITVQPANTTYESYTKEDDKPTIPSDYTDSQIILNSNRLLFNAKKDHILLNSQKTISFNALKGFNFDTDSNFVVRVGASIKLGSKEASQPLIFGDKYVDDMDKLLESLDQLMNSLSATQLWPAGAPVPAADVIASATAVKSIINTIKTRKEEYKSKTSFTD